jgi:DNA-binding winged helix-turn-helix (wHTH) protein
VPAERFGFGPFELDMRSRRLLCDGVPVSLSGRNLDLLHMLVSRAGEVLSKDQLIGAAWPDVAVTDNSLEQAISVLRRALKASPEEPYIETQARRGYRFGVEVTRLANRETDEALEALLAPHRAWMEGRAALETLERDQVVRARGVFADVLRDVPTQAPAHVGMANACAMQFEMTRSDELPDTEALQLALHHAKEACRLDPQYGEAWATLGFVHDRNAEHELAIAASRRAIQLEPDNWRHHFRLASVGWGDERLRAARRTLALLPGFALAHWLAATVHVARNAFAEARRELELGLEGHTTPERFGGIALHWLRGLIFLAEGDSEAALDSFRRELASESSGHLYARECAANTWYAIGAVHLRAGRLADALHAFDQAITRVRRHPLAHLGRLAAGAAPTSDALAVAASPGRIQGVDLAVGRAVMMSLRGQRAEAARIVEGALATEPLGPAGWILPIEPLLHVQADPDTWAPALTRLRMRSA